MPSSWREALLWAVLVALLLEFAINTLARRTVWHRLDALEHRVQQLERGGH
jgi:hypothetical protein